MEFEDIPVGAFFIFSDKEGREFGAYKTSTTFMCYQGIAGEWLDDQVVLKHDTIIDYVDEGVVPQNMPCICDFKGPNAFLGCRCGGI